MSSVAEGLSQEQLDLLCVVPSGRIMLEEYCLTFKERRLLSLTLLLIQIFIDSEFQPFIQILPTC